MKPEKAEARRQDGAPAEESGQNLEGADWRAEAESTNHRGTKRGLAD